MSHSISEAVFRTIDLKLCTQVDSVNTPRCFFRIFNIYPIIQDGHRRIFHHCYIWRFLNLATGVVFRTIDLKLGVYLPCLNTPRRFSQIFDIYPRIQDGCRQISPNSRIWAYMGKFWIVNLKPFFIVTI